VAAPHAPGFGYARLWRNLFDRLTVTYGLNNLLWVWNPNAPRETDDDEAGPYADYYPGGEVVDVLATDIYHNDYRDSHATGLLALAEGRLIALGEVGRLFRFNQRDFIQSVAAHLDGVLPESFAPGDPTSPIPPSQNF